MLFEPLEHKYLCLMNTNTTQSLSQIEKKRLANRISYQRNKEKRMAAMREYYAKNRDKCIDRQRLYRKKNESYKEKCKAIYRERYNTQSDFKLLTLLRGKLVASLKAQNTDKTLSITGLIGCDLNRLKAHLESQFEPGMSWDNHTTHGWHVDHIIPVNTFNLKDPEQLKKAFHYTNLRPLWARDNWSRPKNGSDLLLLEF
jgi:hypothetical protein